MTHKIRVHELAKEYEMSNKDFIDLLKDMDIDVSSHLAGLSEEQVEEIRKELSNDGKEAGAVKNNIEKPEIIVKEENEDIKKDKKNKKMKKDEKSEDDLKVIKMKDEISVKEFAKEIDLNATELVKKLFLKGQMLNINSSISFELAEEIALEYDCLVEKEEEEEISFGDKFNLEVEDQGKDLEERAPVITIMGHVDHGKTSLLDAIRTTEVAEGEAGGITQSIGAYQIEKNGKKITFIDTPGHEAFTDMRARGAKVTDIAILVVAADDGVMPQTVEAISHAKAAAVPIIIAVNKIDKEGSNPMKVKQELTEYGLVPAEWGGDVDYVEVSAKQRLNLDELLETILITSELLELKANPKKRAKGIVLESRLDNKMGPVADVLIQEGTLNVGEVFVAGESYGRVRAMIDDRGRKIKQIGPSMPAEIIGFNTVPEAGDVIYVMRNEKDAKRITDQVIAERKIEVQNKKKHLTLDDLHNHMESEKLKDLKLIVKADTKGSVEALKDALIKLSNEEVDVNIIHSSAGAITEGDVKLAEASDAIIIGFNVRPTTNARIEAEREKVEIRNYNVIYHVTEDVEKAIKGMLDPIFKEVYLGRAEIKKVYKISKIGIIGGAFVVDGRLKKESSVRLLRNGIIIFDGELASLKRYTSDANEVVSGQECGLSLEKYNDIKDGDIIEAYTMEEVKR